MSDSCCQRVVEADTDSVCVLVTVFVGSENRDPTILVEFDTRTKCCIRLFEGEDLVLGFRLGVEL